jgi:hypothetical protein
VAHRLIKKKVNKRKSNKLTSAWSTQNQHPLHQLSCPGSLLIIIFIAASLHQWCEHIVTSYLSYRLIIIFFISASLMWALSSRRHWLSQLSSQNLIVTVSCNCYMLIFAEHTIIRIHTLNFVVTLTSLIDKRHDRLPSFGWIVDRRVRLRWTLFAWVAWVWSIGKQKVWM